MGDKRASKLEQDDFLRLLATFNAAGFHFTASGVGDETQEAAAMNFGEDDDAEIDEGSDDE